MNNSAQEEVLSTVSLSQMQRHRERMMAAPCKPQHLQNQRPSLSVVALVLITCYFLVTESAPQDPVHGLVGGNVTFHCPSKKNQKVTFFYLQRGEEYVNGFYENARMPDTGWKNTRVEANSTTVHMYDLNISHAGEYSCLIGYHDKLRPIETKVSLRVTAPYSKPEVSVFCGEENRAFTCLVTCKSHGGYPQGKMDWKVRENQSWSVVNNSDMQDSVTQLFNSSSTASFNCSSGKPDRFSCFVGDAQTEFIVCEPKPLESPTGPDVVIAAICAVGIVIILLLLALLLWRKCKNVHRGAAAAADVRREWSVNGHEEEVVQLNET